MGLNTSDSRALLQGKPAKKRGERRRVQKIVQGQLCLRPGENLFVEVKREEWLEVMAKASTRTVRADLR